MPDIANIVDDPEPEPTTDPGVVPDIANIVETTQQPAVQPAEDNK